VNDLFMIQHVIQPTFQLSNGVSNNTLDLIFTTQQESVAGLDYLPALSNVSKAHLMLKFNYILGDSLPEVSSNLKFDYRKGNYSDLTKFISASDWVELFNFQSVQCMYDTFILKLNIGCNRFVPVIDTRKKS